MKRYDYCYDCGKPLSFIDLKITKNQFCKKCRTINKKEEISLIELRRIKITKIFKKIKRKERSSYWRKST